MYSKSWFSTAGDLVPSPLTYSSAELLSDRLLGRNSLIFTVAATDSWQGIIRLIRLLAKIAGFWSGIFTLPYGKMGYNELNWTFSRQ